MSVNAIELAAKYSPLLDTVYRETALTSLLDTRNGVIFQGANEAKVPKYSMDGLGDYSRNSGYTTGSITVGWETFKLEQDRGRQFLVDAMDNEETMDIAFGTAMGEFVRNHEVPEVDAYRFAKYAGKAGNKAPETDIDDTTDVRKMIMNAAALMNDKEVNREGRILYISNDAYKQLQANCGHVVMNGEKGISTAIDEFEEMKVIRVPSTRFYSAITLQDGKTTGQEKGGYKPATGAKKINFLIVEPSAVLQLAKHTVLRGFNKEQVQEADAYKFNARIYHDCDVYANKTDGIYVSLGKTAVDAKPSGGGTGA